LVDAVEKPFSDLNFGQEMAQVLSAPFFIFMPFFRPTVAFPIRVAQPALAAGGLPLLLYCPNP
jgi:hypothetical protein